MKKNRVVAAVALMLVTGSLLLPAQVAAEPKHEGVVVKSMGTQLGTDALDVKVIKEEGDRFSLRIRNRTPFIVIIYIAGHRVGWLRPFRTGVMRGLVRGFHRLYAHSRWGSFYWGPRSVWVPGSWNLYR